MKKHIRRTMIIISMLLIICVALGLCQNYLFVLDDHNVWRIKGFYLEDKDSLDVVCMGSSDVFTGYIPGKAYENYGYTSFDFASNSASVVLWKSQLKEILKHQNPQLIVIEINGALYESSDKLFEDSFIRLYTDNIPFSINKVETVNECDLQEMPISYYLSFIKYRSDFLSIDAIKKSIKESLYYKKQGFAALRGFMTHTHISDEINVIEGDFKERLPLNKEAEEYLIGFLEYCKEKNLNNIVFTRFPHRITNQDEVYRVYRSNRASDIISSYGYDFINLETSYNEIGLDVNRDFYNDDHLNIFGAQKLTKFLSEIIIKQYGVVPVEQTEKQRNEWQYSVEYTNKFICEAERKTINEPNDTVFYEKASMKTKLFQK